MKWDDLTKKQQEIIKRMAPGGASLLLTDAEIEEVRPLGIIEEKLGGPGLNSKGKELYAKRVAAIKRRR